MSASTQIAVALSFCGHLSCMIMCALQMALKAADICNLCDPRTEHIQWVMRLEEEVRSQTLMCWLRACQFTTMVKHNTPNTHALKVYYVAPFITEPIQHTLRSESYRTTRGLHGYCLRTSHSSALGTRTVHVGNTDFVDIQMPKLALKTGQHRLSNDVKSC